MRKKLRRTIAHMSQDRRNEGNKFFRDMRRNERDLVETEEHRIKQIRKKSVKKTAMEQERTYKLLARGMSSHFYKNLNKSQN